jgi:kumamolisin
MSTEDALGAFRTSAELAAEFGADPADLELVSATLSELGLQILSSDAASRRVRISGTVATISRVFATSLSVSTAPDRGSAGSREHWIRTGSLSIPAVLDGIVTAVLGIDNRPQARPQFRVSSAAAAVSYTPLQLGELYEFPSNTDGSGQTIAIIELGGGFEASDLKTYFAGLKVAEPNVKAVGVDGAKNIPGKDPTGADGEVLLDIEIAGALAPAAKFLVYFAPNTRTRLRPR